MARSHRRLATIAATGALAGLATLAAAGSASAATTPHSAAAATSADSSDTVYVVTPEDGPVTVPAGVHVVVVVHEGVLTDLLDDLL